MIKKPNSLQRLLHRFVMLRPVTLFFAARIHRLDGMILKLTNGKHTLSELLGWYIVQLKTTGAKTGKPHTAPLIGVIDGEKIALIASSFGRQHNPGWYYNLKKNPECDIHLNARSGKYLARETSGAEREKYWQMAVSCYKGYEKYKQHAAHRHIPVMVLEPVK
ncbi:MAG: nitroreductase family deazaflavin-dependent oxidoreductase [Anaerolineales bacterium]|nr:nitroreductase family deazaflavin-dependent oxidoreductase [Anaerolineales bacterium]